MKLKDVAFDTLTVAAQVIEETILVCELIMTFEMIYQLLLAMTTKVIESDSLRKLNPLEVENSVGTLDFLPLPVPIIKALLDQL